MDLSTCGSVLSMDVMGTVYIADEGARPVRQSVYLCVYAIMLDQNLARSSAVFLQKFMRLIREGRLGILDPSATAAEQILWDTLWSLGKLRSCVEL